MRYQFTPTEKRYDGKMVFKTTYYPNIPESDDDLYIEKIHLRCLKGSLK